MQRQEDDQEVMRFWQSHNIKKSKTQDDKFNIEKFV